MGVIWGDRKHLPLQHSLTIECGGQTHSFDPGGVRGEEGVGERRKNPRSAQSPPRKDPCLSGPGRGRRRPGLRPGLGISHERLPSRCHRSAETHRKDPAPPWLSLWGAGGGPRGTPPLLPVAPAFSLSRLPGALPCVAGEASEPLWEALLSWVGCAPGLQPGPRAPGMKAEAPPIHSTSACTHVLGESSHSSPPPPPGQGPCPSVRLWVLCTSPSSARPLTPGLPQPTPKATSEEEPAFCPRDYSGGLGRGEVAEAALQGHRPHTAQAASGGGLLSVST